MPPSRKNVKCKYLLKKAGGEPVRKRIAKPTAGWKPIRWRCTLCKWPKKWPGEVCSCVEHERWRAKNFYCFTPLDTAPSSDDEKKAGMSPKGGAPDEAQAIDIMFGETWVCSRCTFAGNPFYKRRSGNRMSLPCEVCRWGD